MYMRQKYRQRKSDEDLLDDALRHAVGKPPSAGDARFRDLLDRLRQGEKGSEGSDCRE